MRTGLVSPLYPPLYPPLHPPSYPPPSYPPLATTLASRAGVGAADRRAAARALLAAATRARALRMVGSSLAVLGAEHCAGNDAGQLERAQRAQLASGGQTQKRSKGHDHDAHQGEIARQMPELGYHGDALHPSWEYVARGPGRRHGSRWLTGRQVCSTSVSENAPRW
jgi:hypothetical protein